MSLLLRSKLRVVLCPDQLSLTTIARGWRQPVSETIVLRCKPMLDDPGPGAAVVAMLGHWIEGHKGIGAVEVVLSDRLVRYFMLPWSADVLDASERLVMARIHFEALYGPMSGQWEIQVSAAVYGQARIACAIDTRLLSSLRDLFILHKLRMVSLRPYLMCVVNRWRSQITGDALLVVRESDHCTMAGFKGGAWHGIRSVRIAAQNDVNIGGLIDREVILQGLEGVAVYIHAPGFASPVVLRSGEAATVLMNSANDDAPASVMERVACGV